MYLSQILQYTLAFLESSALAGQGPVVEEVELIYDSAPQCPSCQPFFCSVQCTVYTVNIGYLHFVNKILLIAHQLVQIVPHNVPAAKPSSFQCTAHLIM